MPSYMAPSMFTPGAAPPKKRPLFAGAQETAARFTGGGPGMTDFQRALYTQKADATSSAFDNARSRSRERGAAAGFDYTSGIAQSNDAAIENERARAIGNIGNEVSLETAPLELNAANLGLSADRAQAGLDDQRNQRKRSIFGGIVGGGLKVASGFGNKNGSVFQRILAGLGGI